ncbi:MAG: CopG family transcriptional regulator [Pirellulales bacterium]
MQLNLPSDINAFVQNLVTQGRFENEQEAVVEGIRLLMSREQLRAEIQEGIRQLDDDEWVDGDEAFRETYAEIAEVKARKSESA